MILPVYNNNTLVRRSKDGGDYLAIHFAPTDEHNQHEVSLSRYTKPGRMFNYRFELGLDRSELSYITETSLSLVAALKLLRKDLNRPSVVRMLAWACSQWNTATYGNSYPMEFRRYTHQLVRLLAVLDPTSKSCRECKKIRDAMNSTCP